MSRFHKLFAFIFLVYCSQSNAQTDYMQNPDVKPKCENIKSGTFMSLEVPEEEWTMVIDKDIQTEYFDNGKNFIKAKMHFETENPCKYHLVVTENTDPSNGILKGTVYHNTILQTELNMIRIKSENDEVGTVLTLEKIKE